MHSKCLKTDSFLKSPLLHSDPRGCAFIYPESSWELRLTSRGSRGGGEKYTMYLVLAPGSWGSELNM